ncbi:MAG TPA: hypothetical protein VHE33_19880 [Acidobacteriaceae bacterium]|nr:hypothetical protein [Acidobacteriaceae bacterium]
MRVFQVGRGGAVFAMSGITILNAGRAGLLRNLLTRWSAINCGPATTPASNNSPTGKIHAHRTLFGQTFIGPEV